MPSKLRKTQNLGSHVSHGHSHLSKHRKHPEGQGNAGGMYHHRINSKKHHPRYFGKASMRQYHLKRNPGFCPTINHDKLWPVVSTQTWVNELLLSLVWCDWVTAEFWGRESSQGSLSL
uniref:Large ribosomal subunit protein uL15 n=1 Tax=Moschus moschiferus TaxID=68415 RepID=A0A8C6DI66_MOSMO